MELIAVAMPSETPRDLNAPTYAAAKSLATSYPERATSPLGGDRPGRRVMALGRMGVSSSELGLYPQFIPNLVDEFVADRLPARGDGLESMPTVRLGQSVLGTVLQRFAHQFGSELSSRLALPLSHFLDGP